MALKIAILGTRGIPAKYGGFETYAEEISKNLVKIGHKVTVYNPHYNSVKNESHNGVDIKYIFSLESFLPGKILKAVSTIIYDTLSLLKASFSDSDIIILCGYASGPFMLIPKIFKKKLIVNPDGFEWNSSRWGTIPKQWLYFCERISSLVPDHLIADSEVIRQYFIDKYNCKPTTITYGAELISFAEKSEIVDSNKDYFLIIARIVPETSIPLMIKGFIMSKSKKNLYVVGPIKDDVFFEKEVRPLIETRKNIFFLGPIYSDGEVIRLRYNAISLLHGHASEGTNPSLLESMATGSFILSIRKQSNVNALSRKFDVFFESSQELSEKIVWLESLNDFEFSKIKEHNFDLAKKNFSWIQKAYEHEKVFTKVLKKENK
tara:strand:+ start:4736 stop:5866 length:1131 start_codon:yes stop_codon:yes gene_type:complete